MRGAFGKPQGKVARVEIGQILISIRTKDNNQNVVMEALRRAKYKFPGRQKIIISRKFGFTSVDRVDWSKMRKEKRLIPCGNHVQIIGKKGSMEENFMKRFVSHSY